MRILFVEHFEDFLSVTVIFCKDNGFADLLTVINFNAVGHQYVQHFFNGILIKNPIVKCRRSDFIRQFTVTGKSGFVFLFVFIGQIIINDTLLDKLELGFHRHKINKEAIFYCICELVSVCGNTVFKFKNLISVLIDFIFRRRSKTHQRCVKIVEYITIFIVNGAVRLIANNQIKMTASKEFAFLVLNGINTIHHSLIG